MDDNVSANPAIDCLRIISQPGILAVLKILSNEIDTTGIPRLGCVVALGLYNKSGHKNKTGLFFASQSLGELSIEKSPGWMRNAAEKVGRLIRRHSDGIHDTASAQSADPNNENELLRTYGGALFFGGKEFSIYTSVSGGPPIVDEAMAYVIGRVVGLEFFEGSYRAPHDIFKRALRIYGEYN